MPRNGLVSKVFYTNNLWNNPNILCIFIDTSKLAKLVNRINLNEDYSTTLLNPKLDKDK